VSQQKLFWCGNSNAVFRKFSENAQEDLAYNLDRLQNGLMPWDSKPLNTVAPGVFELRTQDRGVQYRLAYIRMKAGIVVLHCFTKKAQKTPPKEIETARLRLKRVKQELE